MMYRLTVKTVVSALLLGATGVAAADTPVIAPVLEIPNQFIVEYAKVSYSGPVRMSDPSERARFRL